MDVLIRLILRFILVPLGAALAFAAAAAFIGIAHRNALLAVLDADPQAQQDYFVALMFGDDTAWRLGRVSFNPLKHIDPFGTILPVSYTHLTLPTILRV